MRLLVLFYRSGLMTKYIFTKVDKVPMCKNHPDRQAEILEDDLCIQCLMKRDREFKEKLK